MSERAERLAAQFEEVNQELIAFVGDCSAAQWRLVTEAEQWSVGVVLRHVARSFEVYPALIERVASGKSLPAHYTWDDIHRSNAEQAIAWADCTKDETRALLREQGNALASSVRPLSDTQLDRTATSPLTGDVLTTQQLADGMIEHARIHLDSARATVASQERL